MKCKLKNNCQYVQTFGTCISEEGRTCECFERQPTNADRIRAMSDEELVAWMKKIVDCADCPVGTKCIDISQKCEDLLLEWLKQPAE